jgi:hypothetical protein
MNPFDGRADALPSMPKAPLRKLLAGHQAVLAQTGDKVTNVALSSNFLGSEWLLSTVKDL